MLAALVLTPALATANPAPTLESDSGIATAGYFRLSWFSPGDAVPVFELQEAFTRDFVSPNIVYHGRDEAKVMSGRADGEYWYRVRIQSNENLSPWSEPLKVVVQHHPLSRAFGFFAVGAVVFAATLLVIVIGSRRSGKDN